MSIDYFSDEQILSLSTKAKQEKIKRICEKDPIFFINNFITTFNPRLKGKKYIPFRLYGFQEDLIRELHRAYEEDYDILIDKSREMGATWCVLAFIFWMFLFKKGFTCLLGSHREDDVDRGGLPETLFGKIDIMMEHLPNFLKPKMRNNDRTDLKIVNHEMKSHIVGQSATGDIGRSGRFSFMLLDEFAFMDRAEQAFTSTHDTVNSRVFLSTPNGLGNTFADIRFHENTVQGAVTENGQRKHVEMHWRLHPTKGENAYFDEEEGIWKSPWYDAELKRRLTAKDSSIAKVKQELDIHYIQSGDPVFDSRFLKRHVLEDDHPNSFENYGIGVDFSQGMEGGDNQSFDIIAKSTGKQVFHWHGKIPTHELAKLLVAYGEMFNGAMIGIERNNGGAELINKVKELRYRRMYVQKKYNKYTNQSTTNLGWNTDGATKPIMVLDMQSALISGDVKLTNKDTIDEFIIYQILQKEGSAIFKYKAPSGKHDDKVMSLMIAWQVLKDVPMPLSERQHLKRAKLKSSKRKNRFVVSKKCGY